jgi:penicillin V acylase-like amidase (Ntn superfamily)
MLPEPKSEREAIAGILSIIRNVSVPFGAPNNQPGALYNTEYRTAIDMNHPRCYFEMTTSPKVTRTDLSKLNFKAGAPVMVLNPDHIHLSGDVSGKYQKAKKAPF